MYGVIKWSDIAKTLRNKYLALCFADVFCNPQGNYHTIKHYEFGIERVDVSICSSKGITKSFNQISNTFLHTWYLFMVAICVLFH